MVRIRLRRVGARHQPSYRIVAAEKESPRDGRFLEIIGNYNPRTEPATIVIQEDRLFHWLKNGAQPSDAVAKLMRTSGAQERWERFKAGESLEKLLAEAEETKVDVDPRTRRDDLVSARKPAAKPAGAEPEADVVEEKAAPAEEPAAEEEEKVEEAPAEEEASEEEAPEEEAPAAEEPEEEAPVEEEPEEVAEAEEEAEADEGAADDKKED